MKFYQDSQEWSWWLNDLEAAVGPIASGRTYVFGGRPSCGKTMLMQNLATHLATREKKPAVILSCWTERAKIPFLLSLAALIEGYDEDLVLRGKWEQLPDRARERIEARATDVNNGAEHFPILDVACPTADDIAAAIERHRPTVFILDYLQKVRTMSGQTTFDAWMEVMRYCTEYAANGGTAFIGSQLKRRGDGVYDKYRPPYMEDFKGGGGIEEGANLALGLYRPLKQMTYADEKEVKAGRKDLEQWKQHGIMGIKVLKHTFWGAASDRVVRVRVKENRRIVDFNYKEPEVDRGDAWEAPF